jgi:hypothetical protein
MIVEIRKKKTLKGYLFFYTSFKFYERMCILYLNIQQVYITDILYFFA